jgi:nitroreductase
MDLATVDKMLTTTRAVRRRLDLARPVSREVVLECLRLAIQAPTGSNMQTWRWLVVTDPAKRAVIADFYRNPTPPASVRPSPADVIAQSSLFESARYLSEHFHEVPVLVIPCIEESGGPAGWAPSIYPAVWSFMLALRSRGLGSCMTTAHLYHRDETAELLGVPPGFAQACLIPVAYYSGEDFRPAKRRPVEEITYWDEWGATVD